MKKNSALLIFLLLLLLSVLGVNKNADVIASFRANHYFKKNDIAQAQKFYEKAFELGLHKQEDRDIYVNTIINSPLDVKSQEKLVKFLEYPIEDNAKERVKYFLYDFKREIHRKYPDNYIFQTVFNQKVVRWGKNPITYTFENTKDVPQYFIKEIENAFTEWEKVTEHKLMFLEDNENPNIIIKFNNHNPADDEQRKYVVAYTKIHATSKDLASMQIDFYLKDPKGKFFTTNQVYNTALHEIVHALGFMGHSDERNNIIYITKDSMDVFKDERDMPTEADVNTLLLLYEIKPDITNTIDPKSSYIPYVVLGDDELINYAKKREARNYIKSAPNLPSGYIDLAETCVSQEDFAGAIKHLEKALELADTLEIKGIVYYNLAICYLNISNNIMAKDYAMKALEISDSEDIRYLLADIYVKENDYTKAISIYKYLIGKNPQNINYVIGLTNIYVTEKEYFKARKVIQEYFKANPKDKKNPRLNSYGILKLGL